MAMATLDTANLSMEEESYLTSRVDAADEPLMSSINIVPLLVLWKVLSSDISVY